MKTACCGFLVLALGACGGSSRAVETTPPPVATIARGEFMAGLQQMLTPACADATYILRSCFNASEAECVQLYGASLRACIEDPALAIPERIPDTEEAGQHYGELIGVCAGQHYAASMDAQARRTRAPECNQQ